jgi:hypothetical protein
VEDQVLAHLQRPVGLEGEAIAGADHGGVEIGKEAEVAQQGIKDRRLAGERVAVLDDADRDVPRPPQARIAGTGCRRDLAASEARISKAFSPTDSALATAFLGCS